MAENGNLKRKQQKLIQAIVLGQSVVAAAKAIGIGERTAHRWLDMPEVQAERKRLEDEIRQAEEAEITRILTTGYSTIHKRIEELSYMADLIKLSFLAKNDEGKEGIEFKWVTPEKIKEFRGCLDDIAKELGHRVQKKEITGKDGGAIQIQRNPDLSHLSDEELATLLRLEQAAIERAG